MALVLVATPAMPQAATPAATDQRDEQIKTLLKRLENVEAELRNLKAAGATSSITAGSAVLSAAARPAESEEGELRGRFPEFRFHGFGDIDYVFNNREGERNTFALGQLDFFITSRLAEDINFLAESVVEANEENEFGFEIERLLLQYYPNDYVNISAGRYHTAIGYYSTAFHHGTWFQTAVGRPSIFNFEDEGGPLPIHNVGATVSGNIPSGKLGLRYTAEVGNGRNYTPDAEPVLTVADDNDYKSLNLALMARPEWSPGLQVGASVYHDKVTPEGSPRIDQTIFSVHAVYIRPAFELLNEAVLWRHEAKGDKGHYTPAFYSQISRKFGRYRPYLRYQYINAPGTDPIFQLLGQTGRRHGPTVGLRYDLSDFVALKAQYEHIFQREGKEVNEITFQASFTF
jgi:hypothetical protein